MNDSIVVMIADLIFIGLFVWLYFVVFDDTDLKDKERKKKIDGLFGRGCLHHREKKK